jgi:hypothetical protein
VDQGMGQINLFIALGGLLLLTLVTASLFKRYQERMAEKRRRIQRLLRGVDQIERLLFQLESCPLQPEVEMVLREDILRRFRRVREIHPRYKSIDVCITEADEALKQPRLNQEPEIRDAQHLQKVIASLNEVIGFLQQGRLAEPVKASKLSELVELIATRRAEAVFRFHRRQAEGAVKEGRRHDAIKHYNNIRSYLYENGPTVERVKQWYEETGEMKERLKDAG